MFQSRLICQNIKQESYTLILCCRDAGWTEGKDWLNEVELSGMPNKSEVGYADYVLYDDMHASTGCYRSKANLC